MTSLDKIEISIILVFVKSKLTIPEDDTLLITLLKNYDTVHLQFCIDHRSTNSNLHHADPHKHMPSTSPWQVGNTICTKTHQKKKKKSQRERPIDLREELEAFGFGFEFGFMQNQEIKRVQES